MSILYICLQQSLCVFVHVRVGVCLCVCMGGSVKAFPVLGCDATVPSGAEMAGLKAR